jgi:hypothetical protein
VSSSVALWTFPPGVALRGLVELCFVPPVVVYFVNLRFTPSTLCFAWCGGAVLQRRCGLTRLCGNLGTLHYRVRWLLPLIDSPTPCRNPARV